VGRILTLKALDLLMQHNEEARISTEEVSHQENIHERVQKDMEFLKESCANMIEDEVKARL
jgi:hypothetical protein